ncbi:uncharacterized protein E0L32_012093 [Thyridium curvatum]|uniref:U3 small nucleolar ribonucleoprotein protein MPP10 n=1 Tax=Thyridium curvatum TaxID=1093900 RepID=A0A507BDQ2_9PEZI|nr:uncharacterized protein E0L32_012093 [Thyridium curvatum]TPX17613.1 hypothetical protein E0L32_012093 [Thyridium curvatum]
MISMPPAKDMASVLAFLDAANRHVFLQPPSSVPTASLQLAKDTLDAFAGQVSDEQQQQLREAGKKRKRGGQGLDRGEVLKIRKLHIDGFETGQVWQQAKRIISSALLQSEETLRELEESNQIETGDGPKQLEQADIHGEDESEGSDSESEAESSGDNDSQVEEVNEDEQDSDDLDDLGDLRDDWEEEEDEEGLEGEEGDDVDDDEEDFDDEPEQEFVEDPNGLNDGFFSIDDFNKQTQWFEDQDARADPNTDAADDDDELDWHADPMSQPQGKPQTSRKGGRDEEDDPELDEEDEDDEAGPTFGNMALDAPEGDSDDEMEENIENGMDLDLTANDIFYKDFFAPPPKKAKKGAKPVKRSLPKPAEIQDEDVERAMADVRRDLFENLSDQSDSEDALSEVSAGDPRSRRSAHERRQAKLLEEIRKLESEAVKEKKWTLSGEASAPARPHNSLLDEELDFEYVGKPVPVITQEVSEDIEDMIKRRILAQEFDDVIRRLPTGDLPANTRRGLIEIDDKQGKSLAEIYEEEHVKNADPDSYVSKADEKLQKEEREVEQMWKELSAKLDSLSSWHYKPKPAEPSLTVVADVATIAMEDAQPTTAQGVAGGESMIAPQEVYRAGKETAEKGEVVNRDGLPVARQEMTREDRTRKHRRNKERIRKSGAGDGKQLSKKAQEKQDTIAELKRGGVKVINRKGEIVDAEGNKAKAAQAATSGSFKL